MQKSAKRPLSIMLLAALLVSAASCGGEVSPSETSAPESTAPEVTTPADPRTERESIDDGLPDKTYGGATFTVATETGLDWTVIQEESTGDVIDDAIYNRNLAVEDRFKVKIEVLTDAADAMQAKITNIVQAGEDAVDLCMTHVVMTGSVAMNGNYMNWYDVPYVDFDKPWWADSTVDDLSVKDVCLLAIGDYDITALANTYCVLYNKKLAEEYSLGDIYGLVNDGKWTIDKALELTKDIYIDLNSNSKADGKDLFGYITTARSALNTYLWAFGGHVLQKNQSGDVELVYHSSKTNDIVQKLCSFFFDNEGIYINSKEPEYSSLFSLDCFIDGRAVFINGVISQAVDYLREMKDDFGIIPYPKWDEAQEDYYTMVDGSHDILCVPVTVSDTERTGIITEALCAESYKKVVPAYYETALKTKYTRDDESIAMIDKVVNSRVFDLGYVYDGWKGASFIFQSLISANKTDFESYWASKESAISTYYNTVIDYFENYGK